MPSASRSPISRPPAMAGPAITATPATAARVAAMVALSSRSPISNQAMPAVRNGIVASMTITSPMLESRMPFRKHTVASAEHRATSSPSRPIARQVAAVRPRSCHAITPEMNRPAKIPRQNSRVQASTAIRRVKKPAVL